MGTRRRIRGARGRRLQRGRSELVERPFAHQYETGGLRRVRVRGHDNVRKRVLIQAAGCNIGLLLRRLTGVGTPRSLQGRALSAICGLVGRLIGPLGASDERLGLENGDPRRSSAQSLIAKLPEQASSANRLSPISCNARLPRPPTPFPRGTSGAEAAGLRQPVSP